MTVVVAAVGCVGILGRCVYRWWQPIKEYRKYPERCQEFAECHNEYLEENRSESKYMKINEKRGDNDDDNNDNDVDDDDEYI